MTTVETEIKLALAPEGHAALHNHPALAKASAQVHELHSRYLDTPEHDLRRRRMALRLRHTGRGWVQTLKAEGDSAGVLSRRHEWEVDIPGPQLDIARFPEKARAVLAEIDTTRLAVVFETRFRREIRLLDHDGARIELALDDGEVKAGQCHARIHEIELELKNGRPEALFSLALELAAEVPLSFEPASKAQRGWQLAGVPLAVPLKAKALPAPAVMGDARDDWQRMLNIGLIQLSANFSGTVTGADHEYLHQLRVAVRRLLTIAPLTRDLKLPDPVWVASLKGVMDAAAVVRDWDVFCSQTLPRLASVLKTADALNVLRAPAVAARNTAQEALVAHLRSTDFARCLLQIGLDAVRSLGACKLSSQAWARGVLEERRQQARKLLKHYASLDAGQRHRLRLRIKRLRYTADAFAVLWGESAQEYMEILGRLQDGLGEANDQVVAERLLKSLEDHGDAFAQTRGMALAALPLLPLPEDLLECCDALRVAQPFWMRECC